MKACYFWSPGLTLQKRDLLPEYQAQLPNLKDSDWVQISITVPVWVGGTK